MKQWIKKEYQPYRMMAGILGILTIFAFFQQSFTEIIKGLVAIHLSRSALMTDYMQIGGVGAALMNSVIIGIVTILFLMHLKIVPTGATIMAIFLSIGFALFGKNLINMIPLMIGIWLYTKSVKKLYSEYHVMVMLVATISPITSELVFLDLYYFPINMAFGVACGVLAGFLFPMITEMSAKIHRGYNLYNMGFVGGLLSTLFIAFLSSMGIEVQLEYHISSGNTVILAVLLYLISLFLMVCGLFLGDTQKLTSNLLLILQSSGKLPSDYYQKYGANVYVNMSLLCAVSTSFVLLLGAELNGPTLAGILTITGFGAVAKHLKNATPLWIGAIIATQFNQWDVIAPTNVLTILLASGLSPIAGRYGAAWGIIAGFVHVYLAYHIGSLSRGLNLYSNGFAAGFCVLMLLPIIEGFIHIRRQKSKVSEVSEIELIKNDRYHRL